MRIPPVLHPLEPAHVLLVDDNRGGLAARKTIIEELGHKVSLATGSEDALTQFTAAKFDLVITDHRLSRLNGVELIRKLRAIRPMVPILLLSGYVEALGLTEANTGADAVLPKSANEVTHLIRAVTRLLRPKAVRKPPAAQRRRAIAKRQER